MMKKVLLSLFCLGFMSVTSNAQCPLLTTIDEDFNSFTTFPENCWTASHKAPNFSLVAGEIQFYSFSNSGDDFYLVSPEFSTIPTGKVVSFDATQSGMPGAVTVQVGTLATATGFSTFSAGTGAPVTINTTNPAHVSNAFTIGSGHKFIAFKIKASAAHQALKLDNLKFIDAPKDPVSISEHNDVKIKVFPVPFANHFTVEAAFNIDRITLLDVTGRVVATAEPMNTSYTQETSQLPSGVYVLSVTSNNETVKYNLVK